MSCIPVFYQDLLLYGFGKNNFQKRSKAVNGE